MGEPDWPRDEYDTYVGKSMRLLDSGASDEEFIAYLEHIVGKYIGLGDDGIRYSKPYLFVDRMRSWY